MARKRRPSSERKKPQRPSTTRRTPRANVRGLSPKNSPADPQARARHRAVRALSLMRSGQSLAQACRAEHIKPVTFRRLVGNAVRQDRPGGRFRVLKTDHLRREVRALTPQGPKSVSVTGVTTARRLGVYLNAVAHFNRTGDESRLRPFRGKAFRIAGGGQQAFVTDPDTLIQLAGADALHVDSLYASVGTSAR